MGGASGVITGDTKEEVLRKAKKWVKRLNSIEVQKDLYKHNIAFSTVVKVRDRVHKRRLRSSFDSVTSL